VEDLPIRGRKIIKRSYVMMYMTEARDNKLPKVKEEILKNTWDYLYSKFVSRSNTKKGIYVPHGRHAK